MLASGCTLSQHGLTSFSAFPGSRQALSPAAPPAEDALPVAAAAASARLATPPWELHRQAMAALAEPDLGDAAKLLGLSTHPGRAEALLRCAHFQQRLAAAGDEQLLRAWLPPCDVAHFMAAGGGAEAASQREGLLLQASALWLAGETL